MFGFLNEKLAVKLGSFRPRKLILKITFFISLVGVTWVTSALPLWMDCDEPYHLCSFRTDCIVEVISVQNCYKLLQPPAKHWPWVIATRVSTNQTCVLTLFNFTSLFITTETQNTSAGHMYLSWFVINAYSCCVQCEIGTQFGCW